MNRSTRSKKACRAAAIAQEVNQNLREADDLSGKLYTAIMLTAPPEIAEMVRLRANLEVSAKLFAYGASFTPVQERARFLRQTVSAARAALATSKALPGQSPTETAML